MKYYYDGTVQYFDFFQWSVDRNIKVAGTRGILDKVAACSNSLSLFGRQNIKRIEQALEIVDPFL